MALKKGAYTGHRSDMMGEYAKESRRDDEGDELDDE